MGYLLDTNVLIWLATAPQNLGKKSQNLLESQNAFHYSPLSLVEIRVKEAKGKIKLRTDLARSLAENQIFELPFLTSHVEEFGRFAGLINHDPFDRMLLAQASCERLKFVTADDRLIALGLPWVMDATV